MASMVSRCITSRTILAQNWQSALVRERDKVAAAARLALEVLVAEGAITAVQVAPDLAVRHTHWNLEVVELIVRRFVALKSFAPS